MEEKRTLASDLKKLEQAVPRSRLLAYAAVIALVSALVVWATLMRLSERQEAETQGLRQEADGTAVEEAAQEAAQPSAAPAAPPQAKPSSGGTTSPWAVPTSWRSVTSADGKYQMDLPAGAKLAQSDGMTYVIPESPAGALPLMAIKIATGVDKQGYKPDPANSVMIDIGLDTYWLYTWQFKTWEPFSRVVDSFKVLK